MKLPFLFISSYSKEPNLYATIESIYLRFVFGLVQANKKTVISFPNGWRRVPTPVFNSKGGLGMNMARSFPLKSVLRVV